jgi:hypothetical protein
MRQDSSREAVQACISVDCCCRRLGHLHKSVEVRYSVVNGNNNMFDEVMSVDYCLGRVSGTDDLGDLQHGSRTLTWRLPKF